MNFLNYLFIKLFINGWRRNLTATTQLRMLKAILNKSWRQHPTRHQLYGHLPPISKTIQVRRARHAGHCWRSNDELVSDVLQWTPTYGQAKAGRPARTYIQQLCEDTGCNPGDLPEAMNDKEKWRERVRDIRDDGTTLLASAPGPVLDFGPERGSAKGTMADLGPLIRHLVSTRLPSGGRAAFLSPLSPMHDTRPSVWFKPLTGIRARTHIWVRETACLIRLTLH